MKTILFYDSETTGLPLWNLPSEHPDQPRVTQLAALLCDEATGADLQQMNMIILPNGWTIPDEVATLTGLTTERALAEGVAADVVVAHFIDMWTEADQRAGHNESFDMRMLRIELMRHGFYSMQTIGTPPVPFADYWKEGDKIHPDYDTVPLRDVARLYAKYDQLFKFHVQVSSMVRLLKDGEWAEDLAATSDAADLQSVITGLVGQQNDPMLALGAAIARVCPDAPAGEWLSLFASVRREGDRFDIWNLGLVKADQVVFGTGVFKVGPDGKATFTPQPAPPDAVDAARADAVMHGTGAFSVKADGSTEHVDLQRDALHPGYAVPVKPADKGGKPE